MLRGAFLQPLAERLDNHVTRPNVVEQRIRARFLFWRILLIADRVCSTRIFTATLTPRSSPQPGGLTSGAVETLLGDHPGSSAALPPHHAPSMLASMGPFTTKSQS